MNYNQSEECYYNVVRAMLSDAIVTQVKFPPQIAKRAKKWKGKEKGSDQYKEDMRDSADMRRDVQAAHTWMFVDNRKHIGSFKWVCMVLNLDYKAVREGVKERI